MEHPLLTYLHSKEFADYCKQIGSERNLDAFNSSINTLCPEGKGLGYLFKMLVPNINLGGYAPQILIGSPDPLSADPLMHIDENLELFHYRYEILTPFQIVSEIFKISNTVGRLMGAIEAMNSDARLIKPSPPAIRLFDLILAGVISNQEGTGLLLVDLVAAEQLALIGYLDLVPKTKSEIIELMKQTRLDYAEFRVEYEKSGSSTPIAMKLMHKEEEEESDELPVTMVEKPVSLSQINVADFIADLEKGFRSSPPL